MAEKCIVSPSWVLWCDVVVVVVVVLLLLLVLLDIIMTTQFRFHWGLTEVFTYYPIPLTTENGYGWQLNFNEKNGCWPPSNYTEWVWWELVLTTQQLFHWDWEECVPIPLRKDVGHPITQRRRVGYTPLHCWEWLFWPPNNNTTENGCVENGPSN